MGIFTMTNEVKNTARSIARLRIRKFRAALVEVTGQIAICKEQGHTEKAKALEADQLLIIKRLNRLGQTYL